jgi:hypothetical protein
VDVVPRYARPMFAQCGPTLLGARNVVAGLLLVALGAPGCVNRLRMAQADGADPKQPHTRVLYSGVRDAGRRYANYDVVDASILER